MHHFVRHNTITHLIDYSIVSTELLYTLGSQKIGVTPTIFKICNQQGPTI